MQMTLHRADGAAEDRRSLDDRQAEQCCRDAAAKARIAGLGLVDRLGILLGVAAPQPPDGPPAAEAGAQRGQMWIRDPDGNILELIVAPLSAPPTCRRRPA